MWLNFIQRRHSDPPEKFPIDDVALDIDADSDGFLDDVDVCPVEPGAAPEGCPEVCKGGWGTITQSLDVPACWRPYADHSPWNRKVAANPELASNSSAIVAKLIDKWPKPYDNLQNVADTEKDWTHPIYFSQPDDPLFTLHFEQDGDPVTWGTSPILEGTQIRIPDEARPAGAGDAHLSVFDQQTGYEYGFWDVQSKPQGGGTLVAASGGRTKLDANQTLVINGITYDAEPGTNTDASAAYFPPAAGMIRPAELAAGQINHALFMNVPCTNGTNVYPANPNHGAGATCERRLGIPNANAPAIGQRFYLDMTESEINALPGPSWKKTILHAMADYGMYVGDTGGGSWGIQFESGSSYTSFGHADPWVALGDQFGVTTGYDYEIGRTLRFFRLADVVDWGARLKVLEPGP